MGTGIARKARRCGVSVLNYPKLQQVMTGTKGRRQQVFAVGVVILLSELQIEFRQNLNLINEQFVLWQILSH